MILYKPSLEELEPLKQEAFATGLSEKAWLEKMANTIAEILEENPKQYRSLGPYWWGVKQVLKQQGFDFGDFIDAEWFEQIDYGSDVWNMLASYAYQMYAAANGLFESNEHILCMIDDEGNQQAVTYTLIDDDMEARALF